jgi:hypothetical protein
VFTPLLNVAAPERCRQGVYTPVLNAIIPAEARESIKLMGTKSMIAILIHPEVADEMDEYLQRLVAAIEATGKELALRPVVPPPAPITPTWDEKVAWVNPESLPVEKPVKAKPEKGPFSEFWRLMSLPNSTPLNAPLIRQWLTNGVDTVSYNPAEAIRQKFEVKSRSRELDPDVFLASLRIALFDHPNQVTAQNVIKSVEQVAKKAADSAAMKETV